MTATTFVVSSSRPGLPSVVVTDSGSGLTTVVSDVGAEYDPNVAVNANVTLTGVSGTGAVGTVTTQLDASPTLTGISATTSLGTPTESVYETLTGISASAAVGTLTATFGATTTLTGISASAAIGGPSEEADSNVTLVGVAASAVVGAPTIEVDVDVAITGIAATPAIAGVTDWVQETLAGISAAAHVGAVIASVDSNVQLFSGLTAYPFVGIPLCIQHPNFTNVTLDGIGAASALGVVTPASGVPLTGIHSGALVGAIRPVTTASGMGFTELDAVTEVVPPTNINLNLRWSDDRGASWTGARNTAFGTMGAYQTSLQFRRMGMARDRIFEVSWTAPIPTALVGMNIQFEDSAT